MPLPDDFDPNKISAHAPIPNPNGDIIGAPPVRGEGDWSQAPQIVKSVRMLNIIGGILTFLLLVVCFIGLASAGSRTTPGDKKLELFLYIISLAITLPIYVWIIGALKTGSRAAWTGQIILSALGLCSCCPCGFLLHGYILSQWFSPEVKSWFSVY